MIVQPAEIHVERSSSLDGLSPIFLMLARPKPIRHPTRPQPARMTGKRIVALNVASVICVSPSAIAVLKSVTEIMMEADIVATNDSKRSEQLPAMSLTLSPMKSAIVLGILESSSGRSCLSLPRISEEISAAFV